MSGVSLSQIISLFLVPPGIIILLFVLGLILHLKWSGLGVLVLAICTAILIALALPMTGHQLMAGLESYAPPIDPSIRQPDKNAKAIVVLGAGRYADAPEYGGDTVGATDLIRLRYAAWLQRKTGLPIMVSGGSPFHEKVSEASLMRDVLTQEFHANVKWTEDKSRTTWENARYCRQLLADAGIQSVYLVTSAWHMRRAAWSFDTNGITAIPAPTGFASLGLRYSGVLGYLPSAEGMLISSIALRERIGFLWYNLVHSTVPTTSQHAAGAS